MKSPSLILIDMVNDFLRTFEPTARERLLRSTNELIGIMRSCRRPVIWVRQQFRADLSDAFLEMRRKGISVTIEGTPGCEIAAELEVDRAADTVLVKKRYSAFHGTTLDELLAAFAPDGLIIAGINTHACIRMTAIDAYQRDWEVVVAADCVDSYDRPHHEISLRYMKDKIAALMSNAEIGTMLGSASAGARQRRE